MRVTIVAKTMIAALLVIGLVFFLSFIGLRGLASATEPYEDLVNRVDAMRIEAQRLEASQLSKSRAVFGHLLTQDPQYQAALDEAIRESQEIIANMKSITQVAEVQGILADIEEANAEADALLKPILAKSSFTPQEITDLVENQFPAVRNKINASIKQLLQLLDQGAAQAVTSARSSSDSTRKILLGVSAFVVAMAFVIASLFARTLSQPIGAVASVARKLAVGDLRVGELRIGSRDEVGDMAAAVNQLTANMRRVVENVYLHAATVMSVSDQLSSASNAAVQAAQHTSQAIAQVVSSSTDQSKDAVKADSMVGQLKDAIEQIAAGAAKSSSEVQDSATRLNQMLEELETMARSASESAAGARQAVVRAQDGADVVERTLQEIKQIGLVVVESAERIKELDTLSGQIGAITEIISGIADQTNLLALNAAIEAARAGEHGRGFAVVAEEVRKLAERSASSSKEIDNLIHKIQNGTADAVKAMAEGTQRITTSNQLAAEAGHALDELLSVAQQLAGDMENVARMAETAQRDAAKVAETFNSVAALTEQNTAATEEMAAGVTEVTQVIDRAAQVSQENAAAAEEVSASVEELISSGEQVASAARSLAKTAQELQEQMGRFSL